MLGITPPLYTKEELEKFRADNEVGVDYDGQHYTLYEATQRQRKLERAMRVQKRRILADKVTGDAEKLQQDEIRLRTIQQEYARFSKAAGLQTQYERAEVYDRDRKNLFTSSASRVIMKPESEGGRMTINSIESPIEQRNTGKWKPNAIIHFDVDLNHRQQSALEALPEFNSCVTIPKSEISMADLAALTAKTGDEFAMFTRKNLRMVIRGDSRTVNVTENMAMELNAAGYRWSGHTHPGYGPLCLMPSDGDRMILACFAQTHSSIYNSMGQRIIFDKEGIV